MLTFFFPATIIEISAPALTPCTRPWLPIYCLKDTKSPAYQHAALSRPAAPSLEALFGAVLSHLSHVQLCGPLSSILAWKIPWMEEPGRLQSMGSLRVGHDWATSLSLFSFMHWRRKWQPTPVFLPGESQGRRSLVGCRLWGHTESDTTEAT